MNRILIALCLAIGLLISSAPTAVAAKPQLTLSAPKQMKAGVPGVFKVRALRVPAGAKLVLQKKTGAKWTSVKNIGRKGGTVKVATAVGSWKFRAAALKGKKVVAVSRTVTVRTTTQTVSLATLCRNAVVDGSCSGGVVRVGYQDFQFTSWVNVTSAWVADATPRALEMKRATSCTTLTLRVAGDKFAQEYDESVMVAAMRGETVLGSVTAQAGEIGTLTVPLKRAPFYLKALGQADAMALLDGSLSGCTTPTGVL